ncbi:hypothetical protein OKA05_21530 [Luteolibacter arcticus]|uniref:Uncharacterized protein n=1 Tax=Luteolibacter arcticus TaxID=1581411 RepID=A0ABT3GNQ5_9BACT|nr:hypothetical protein [Luteolibacter arcticus]MCW1925156.1 hypothetical protein [Luteolibacter arcticus]
MKAKPATDDRNLVAHEEAANEVAELRRKGVHCHIEETADGPSPVHVVEDSNPDESATKAFPRPRQ